MGLKRFTETTKWSDPWYRRLSERSKLLWAYLTDNCNSIGLIDLDFESASFHIGGKVEEKHLTELVDRVQRLENGKLFIPQFIPFQYGCLSESCPAHKPILKLVAIHQLTVSASGRFQYPNTTLAVGYPYPTGKEPERKGKEPERKGESEGDGKDPLELPENLKSGRFVAAWQRWMTYRRGMKKPGNWLTLFQEQLKWLAQFSSEQASDVLETTMRNGWQGLFKPQVGSHVNGERPLTPMAIKTIIEAKKVKAADLRTRHCSDTAIDTIWSDPKKRSEYFTIQKEIKTLNNQLSNMA